MIDLVYKDIIQNRKLILLYALLGGFVGLVMIASGSDGGGVFTAYVMISTYGFAVRSTYDEDKSGAYLFLKSLPLSDAAIVASKFLSILAVSVMLVIFFNITAVLGAYLGASGIVPGLGSSPAARGALDVIAVLRGNAVSFAMVFSFAVIFVGIYLLIFFWAGFAKASTYSRAILLAVFVVVMIGAGAIGHLPAVRNFVRFIETSSWLPAISVITSLGVYSILCALCIGRVKVKDWS